MTDNKLRKISIVIPTYKRVESLIRLLKSIQEQSLPPKEVIIVAAGLSKDKVHDAIKNFNFPITSAFSEPSVCKQRNIGILKSTSELILLCDDDIELPENYLEKLSNYLDENPDVRIATGEETLLKSPNNWQKTDHKMSTIKLMFNYIFGLPFWSNLNNYTSNRIIKAYQKKGNTISKAGWPIVCDFSYPIMKSTIYGLGCAMFRSNYLKENLYDESLEQHGLGDNYDVALRVNAFENKIHILRNLPYKHYKLESNRLKPSNQYYQRTITLFIFLRKLPYFSFKNQLYFLWSLIGNGIFFLFNGQLNYFYANLKVGLFALNKISKKLN